MKYLALVLVVATPAVLAETINMACPPGDKVVVHTVTNNGDFNGDGFTNSADVEEMKANFGQRTEPGVDTLPTDLNGDGVTGFDDFGLFRMLVSQQH